MTLKTAARETTNNSLSRKYSLQYITNNNQRLQSAGNNDRFCTIAVLCVSFTLQIVKTHMIRIRVIEGPNMHDQSVFCAFHTFLVEVQMNADYIDAMHA